ncbi:unnamed protein product [Sphenostylis stenocarpa]|uniref:CWZF3/5/7 THD domain-containing protein n=1 Tax=Sphenostylis stenocarpa TaxID=92480 RepID=A0AA86TB90_9FABA|nr:unnamed protein product [Sphenostylis stenocarpa]
MNLCEDETTKALYALYQMPISHVQSNIQSHGTQTALGVSSTNSLQYGLNQNMPSSDMCERGRKKLVIKEKAISGINNDMHRFSNSVKANVQKSALGHGLTGKKTEIKPRDFESAVPNMDAQCSIPSSVVGEVKREALSVGSRIVAQYQKGSMSNEHPVKVSSNGDLVKSIINYANVSNNDAANCSFGNFVPHQQPTVSSPVRTNFNQTFINTLKEATKLKERVDNYKNFGFSFESNETYFQASLKFLHGASLLENCHNEISKHGKMSQMQIFSTAAKLFKCCAHEYEARQEMFVAALAYKFMEVAYMRVVYCKNSSINRDQHELQSTLQMVSQGESPSSSASDVDNLYNQEGADRATLPRGY